MLLFLSTFLYLILHSFSFLILYFLLLFLTFAGNSVFGRLHGVNVAYVAKVSEILTASIFRVEVRNMGEFGYIKMEKSTHV
jgi:hypothetical protein